MLDNSLYNFMIQMVEENKNLWRIKNMYKKDVRRGDDCDKFWSDLEAEKKHRVEELRELIKSHV